MTGDFEFRVLNLSREDIDEEDARDIANVLFDSLQGMGYAIEGVAPVFNPGVDEDCATIEQGKLKAALAAGAHPEFVAFVAEYPESAPAETLETAISMDALKHFKGHAGSFVGSFWEHGAAGAGNPDTKNADRMRALFDEDQLPEWMQEDDDEEVSA